LFYFFRALAKNSSFGFLSVGFRIGKNQMCCLCGWLFSLCTTTGYDTPVCHITILNLLQK